MDRDSPMTSALISLLLAGLPLLTGCAQPAAQAVLLQRARPLDAGYDGAR